jgi:uncharacterized protein YjbI with pentapeptide repeats
MSEHDVIQSSTKLRRSRKTNTAIQQNDTYVPAEQRPTNDDIDAWKKYWRAQEQLWRTEPEIDADRQAFLAERRKIEPDIEKGIYPFKDIKLSRADVEWLLATHDNRSGPVDWNHVNQRGREGLDLRGANLSQTNLSRLPMARLRGGLLLSEWEIATSEQIETAAIHLEESDLKEIHIEGGTLIGAYMKKANLQEAYLNEIVLRNAHLEGGDLRWAHLEHAILLEAHIERSDLTGAHLEHARLLEAHLEGADFTVAHLEDARLHGAYMEGAFLISTHLEDAQLPKAHLEWAVLYQAHLERAWLEEAKLQGTDLRRSHLEGANLSNAHLGGKKVSLEDLKRVKQCFHDYPSLELRRGHWEDRLDFPAILPPTDLQEAFFDNGTRLNEAILGDETYGYITVADLSWGGANLAVLKDSLTKMSMLGDEQKALQKKHEGITKDASKRLDEYEQAVRANRQLAIALQGQGLNEDASRFAYRAQKLQRIVLRRRKKFGQYLFSGFLDLLAGYGYRPGRSVIWYLVTIFVFALTYFAIGHISFFPDAFVFSLTSFHGRGFFPGLGSVSTLHNPLVVIAAFEAVIGLVIEISFIATFTQRFFGR